MWIGSEKQQRRKVITCNLSPSLRVVDLSDLFQKDRKQNSKSYCLLLDSLSFYILVLLNV